MAAWKDAAACKGEDTDLFFPDGYGPGSVPQIEKAKAICQVCPVRSACLAAALATPEKYGIFGGLTEQERARERRNAQRRGWPDPVKTCARCQIPQQASQFYRRKGRSDDLDSYCRSCHVELTQERRARKAAVS